MENKEALVTMAKNNEESLRFVSKEMNNLARRIKKTSAEDEEKFVSNLVESSFFLNAYAMGTKAFNAMLTEKDKNPECDRNLPEYFMDEVLKMQEAEMKKEMEEKKNDN